MERSGECGASPEIGARRGDWLASAHAACSRTDRPQRRPRSGVDPRHHRQSPYVASAAARPRRHPSGTRRRPARRTGRATPTTATTPSATPPMWSRRDRAGGHRRGDRRALAGRRRCQCSPRLRRAGPWSTSINRCACRVSRSALSQLAPMLNGTRESFDQALELMFGAMDGPLSADEQARLRQHRRADQRSCWRRGRRCSSRPPRNWTQTVEALAAGISVPYLSLHGMDPGPDYAAWLQGIWCRPRQWRSGRTWVTTSISSTPPDSLLAWPNSRRRFAGDRFGDDRRRGWHHHARPAGQAQRRQLRDVASLQAACHQLAADETVRVVVLRGAGEHFCAGADIADLLAPARRGRGDLHGANMAAENALAALPSPPSLSSRATASGVVARWPSTATCALPPPTRGSASLRRSWASSVRVRRWSVRWRCRARQRSGCCSPAISSVPRKRIASVRRRGAAADDIETRLYELCATLAQRSLLTQAATKEMIAAVIADGTVPAEMAQRWADEVAIPARWPRASARSRSGRAPAFP